MSNNIKIWNFENVCLRRLNIECVDMAVLKNEDLITVSLDNTIRIWNIETGTQIKQWMSEIDKHSHITISASKILIDGENTVTVWQ